MELQRRDENRKKLAEEILQLRNSMSHVSTQLCQAQEHYGHQEAAAERKYWQSLSFFEPGFPLSITSTTEIQCLGN